MLKEFRDFIARGNVIDLAVGIVIGAAFTAIVNSFVKDILSPILGIFGSANFNTQFVVLKAGKETPPPYVDLDAASKAGAVTFNYGSFITAVINFLIVAFALFLIVKATNKFKERLVQKPEEAPAAPPEPSNEEKLLTEIRDLLKSPGRLS
jgi:large conductance mechanosensitive channel